MKKYYYILFLILIIGGILRFFWLHRSPPSLNWDETALGYNAYSLLKTGKDEYGHPFPFVLRSFDDYKPALYAYSTIPFIKLFGLSEISVRFLSALSGISILVLIFFIAKKFFNLKVALISSLILAISPWSVNYSRAAYEANFGLALLLFGILFGLKSKQNFLFLPLSIIFLGLSAYSYHAYKLLLPPLVFFSAYQGRSHLKKPKSKITFLLTVIAVVIPLIIVLKSGEGLQRLESTSITKVWDKERSIFSLIENPLYNMGREITGRYLSYFSPANIFVRGGSEPNQKIPGFALFYTLDLLFFIWGIYAYAKSRFKPRVLLFLILIAPLPAIITWNWFAPVRTLLLYSLLPILTALGLTELFKLLGKYSKILKVGVVFFLAVFYINSVSNLATTLFFYIPYAEKGNWQYGFREIMNYVAPIADKYDKIVFETGHAQPHIFTLFYSKYDPARYHTDLGSPDAVEKPRKNFNFGKYEFRRIYWPDDRGSKNILFIGSEYSLPKNDIATTPNAKILVDIYDKSGDFTARVVETR